MSGDLVAIRRLQKFKKEFIMSFKTEGWAWLKYTGQNFINVWEKFAKDESVTR